MPSMNTAAPVRRARLHHAREIRGWSQEEVADLIGTTPLNVSRWERGITTPGPYFRARLCLLFGKSAQELDLAEAIPTWPVYDLALPLQPSTRLVGREHDLTRLKQQLLAGGITALCGLPGVGKTAVAIELAHDPDIRAHFRDGILWAALGPEPSIPTVQSRWGILLGISSTAMASPSDNDARAVALHRAIGSHSLLLVIDDAWHLEDTLALTAGGKSCAHLVTTRLPGIATALAGEGTTVIRELGEHEGMMLLRMLAPRAVDHEEQKVLELVDAVGGLPLALTLVGRYLHAQAYTGQPRRTAAALERLGRAEERLQLREPRGPLDRHSSLLAVPSLSLRSVFAVTDRQLDNEARAALATLSAFPPKPNSFSEEQALAAGCTREALDLLSDAGLLESAEPGRYTLHPVVADYARLSMKECMVYQPRGSPQLLMMGESSTGGK